MSELAFLEKARQNQNCEAMLDTIGLSEGAEYDSLFGDSPAHPNKITDFTDHPDKPFHYTNKAGVPIITTAAGRYQFIHSTWVNLKNKLSLPDFSPHSQDLAALELLSEKDVLQKLMDGNFSAALEAAKTIWASLPGANDNQPEHSMAEVIGWYKANGGIIV